MTPTASACVLFGRCRPRVVAATPGMVGVAGVSWKMSASVSACGIWRVASNSRISGSGAAPVALAMARMWPRA